MKHVPGKMEDRIYEFRQKRVDDFRFDGNVANVFDDMVERSVPFYGEIQRMVCELARDFTQKNSNVYDLGCSTGTTFKLLHEYLDESIAFIGVDNSASMLDRAKEKLADVAKTRNLLLHNTDIENDYLIEDASVIIMILTFQFVRPLYRGKIARRIYDGMMKNSAFIMVEKLLSADSTLNRLFIDHYYEYKRARGYSQTEIVQKREALENVLIPYRMEENIALLKEAGFRHVEDFFRWYNFSGIIAIK